MPAIPVRKAVIPAAGFGTRLFPATKAIKKEFFPIVDRDGLTKPVILAIVEEALSAGIQEIGLVVQESDRSLFEDFFKRPTKSELFAKLSPEKQQYSEYLMALGKRIELLIQERQEGYGHAVLCAKEWVGNEPFLLLLGDHIYASDREVSCSRQLIEVYEKINKTVVGLTVMPAEIIHKAGCVAGIWQAEPCLLSLTKLWEKPTLEEARSHLHVPGMKEDEFLAVFGLYLLEPQIFDYLADEVANNRRYRGEFQLTTCLERWREAEGMAGYLIEGKYFDTGMPEFYRQTIWEFPLSS